VKLGALTTLVLLLAAAAAGCGGGGTSAEEAWAEEVCTSIATWRTEVESIARNATDALTEPGATRADVEAAVESGLDATKTLGDELRAAVPPDTPEGQEAQAALDGFLDNVQQSDDEVRTAIAGLPENAGVAQIVAELSGLATSLQQTVESGRTLVSDIQELGSALKEGFENADSCQELSES
jgi:methyl-accepting chemotaxis protein